MYQRPEVTQKEIDLINRLISENPTWGRTKLSIELCRIWDWCHNDGRPKEISCRDLLRKLNGKGLITLPKKITDTGPKPGNKHQVKLMLHDTTPVESRLKDLGSLQVVVIPNRSPLLLNEFKSLLIQYHYLGFDLTAGENMKYMVYSRDGLLLACLLFGAAAWTCAQRDNFISWKADIRKTNLYLTTNNTRFLILPWVRVPHLASHTLGLISRRISSDWQEKYGHPVYLLETFVEKDRFKGTCYKAANWEYVGETTGRSRNDRYTKLRVPIKDIYLYPLSRDFREVLTK
ncbi:MAG: DUF4338 domain-containing protein [Thermincola sp.]|jgi:hypothetical protein|nr:DUF4338 domain-containing protein [Thermincola sp.]MDT3703933.1 DUF4338 domain-containing protein [Thermincola sp.]